MRTILLLDDSREDRFIVCFGLKEAVPDADIHEFAYAEEALAFLRSPKRPDFDLLLVDINMPRMTGFEFADAYLELYPELRGGAPVYIMSGSLNPDDAARAEAHPAIAGFIGKPLKGEAIEQVVLQHS